LIISIQSNWFTSFRKHTLPLPRACRFSQCAYGR